MKRGPLGYEAYEKWTIDNEDIDEEERICNVSETGFPLVNVDVDIYKKGIGRWRNAQGSAQGRDAERLE